MAQWLYSYGECSGYTPCKSEIFRPKDNLFSLNANKIKHTPIFRINVLSLIVVLRALGERSC